MSSNVQNPVVSSQSQDESAVPLACNMLAMTAEQRERHEQVAHDFQSLRQEIRELSDGYAFRYAYSESTCRTIAEFISLEHLCCPFFRLTLEIEPGQGSLWLRLTGDEPVKQFVKSEMNLS